MKIENCKLQIKHGPWRTAARAEFTHCWSIFNFQFSIFNFQFFLLFLPLLLLTGCGGCRDSTASSRPTGPGNAASSPYREELLTYALDNLNRLEEFDSADALQQILQRLNPQQANQSQPSDPLLAAWPELEMLRQIVDRLNQWIRTQQPPADWKLDPILAGLPKPLADLPQVKDLGRLEFSRFDGYALQEAVWLRDVGLWARGDALDDLERAKSLFDWTVRNLQLEADDAKRIPQFPWETLLFGRGTATERAWVFILLARQLGIDAAMLGVGDGGRATGREERGEGRKNEKRGLGTSVPSEVSSKSAISNQKSEIPVPRPPSPVPRFWCVAVLIEGHAHLFDPTLGLPIPAPGGVKLDESGQLAIQPATLAQVVADEKLLRQMDVDDTRVYGVKGSHLKHLVVMLEGSPIYLARRTKLLESRLAGPQKMVLTISLTAQAERWKAAAHLSEVRLWLHPFETLERRSHLAREEVQSRLVAMLPFFVLPKAPLRSGRMLYLKGKFVGDDDDGAIHYYQAARPPNEQLSASSAHPIEKLMYLRGKQDASYWLGLVAYQRGAYPAAVDYFTKRTLLSTPNGPWTDGAHYNLGRTFEAIGEPERAMLQYQSNADSPGALGDLLRAKWLKEKGGRRRAEGG